MPKYRRLDTPIAGIHGTIDGIAQQHVLHNREYIESKITAYRELSCFKGAAAGVVMTAALALLTTITIPLLPIAIVLGLCTVSMGVMTAGAILLCLWKMLRGVAYLLRFLAMVLISPFFIGSAIVEGVKKGNEQYRERVGPVRPIPAKIPFVVNKHPFNIESIKETFRQNKIIAAQNAAARKAAQTMRTGDKATEAQE